MKTVETVAGPTSVDSLGTTLMREHVFVLTPDSEANWNQDWDEEANIEDAIEKLRALAATGVGTIVDPTVDSLGRNIPRIKRMADLVPALNIIVATGIVVRSRHPSR